MTQPTPEPFWKKWWVWLLGALIVLGVIVATQEEKGGGPKATSPTQGSLPAAAGIGQEVRDGKFTFVVNSVDRSKTAGDPNSGLTETAQGEYLNVHLTVTNTGDKAQTFFADNQKLQADGKQFKVDSTAAAWSGASNVSINPGNRIDTVVSFDVPAGTPAGVLELHDSAFSDGVKVQLTQPGS
jgi:hypothetical protein